VLSRRAVVVAESEAGSWYPVSWLPQWALFLGWHNVWQGWAAEVCFSCRGVPVVQLARRPIRKLWPGVGLTRERCAGMRFVPGERAPHSAGGHLAAVREAFAGMSAGRLPPQLLFSDRDFTEADYEMLLALDEGVENRRGAPSCRAQDVRTYL